MKISSPSLIPSRQMTRVYSLTRIFPVNIVTLDSPLYVYKIKGVNYYPSTHPWDAMYDNLWWSSGTAEKEIKNELNLLKNIGVNTIRIFARYNMLGGATVDTTKRGFLENIITWAGQFGIKSIVTLFDGLIGTDFDPSNWSNHKSHLNGVVGYFKTNPNILAWDLKNEYPLIYTPINQPKTEAWAREMILYIKSLDTQHPITAESDAVTSQWLADLLDFNASHLYNASPEDNGTAVANYYSNTSLNKGRPYYCGETGWSSAILGLESTDTRDRGPIWQTEYIKRGLDSLKDKSAGVLIWTGFEFPTLAKNDRERWFGIVTSPTYRYKESARYFAQYLPTFTNAQQLFCDQWNTTTDFQNFETILGLSVVTGTWALVSDTQQDGTTGNVARQSDTSFIGGWNGKVAVSTTTSTFDHMHVECYVKLETNTGSREIGLLFGYNDINNTYRIYINNNFGTFSLKLVSGGAETVLTEVATSLASGTWYKISVSVHKNTYGGVTYHNIRGFLNDGSLSSISFDKSSPLPSGKAGIYTQGDTIGRFNNYKATYITKTRVYL